MRIAFRSRSAQGAVVLDTLSADGAGSGALSFLEVCDGNPVGSALSYMFRCRLARSLYRLTELTRSASASYRFGSWPAVSRGCRRFIPTLCCREGRSGS